jgi:hypothetical protein
LGDVVELSIGPQGLMIAPHRAARAHWREALAGSPPAEILLNPAPRNKFDDEEWEW